jgi:dimethylaniline monooxygenase (N-oxide forming)
MSDGKAFDHGMTRRGVTIIQWIASIWPSGCAALMAKAMLAARRKAFPWLDNHSSFQAPRKADSPKHRIPVFSDDLADNLRDGSVQALPGISEVMGPKSIRFTDGRVIEDVDTIIFCSGYHYDTSLLPGVGNPADPAYAPDRYTRVAKTKHYNPDDPFLRLYHGFLSEQFPDSLAFLGYAFIMKPPFVLNDLITMALASIWSGSYRLPTAAEMAKDINSHYDYTVQTLEEGPIPHLGFRIDGLSTYLWLNVAAGTGVTDRVACWSAAAWKLWYSDRRFYNMLMDGIQSPAIYRLFDTGRGRKPWGGAREQIEKANKEVTEMVEAWKLEESKKTK